MAGTLVESPVEVHALWLHWHCAGQFAAGLWRRHAAATETVDSAETKLNEEVEETIRPSAKTTKVEGYK